MSKLRTYYFGILNELKGLRFSNLFKHNILNEATRVFIQI